MENKLKEETITIWWFSLESYLGYVDREWERKSFCSYIKSIKEINEKLNLNRNRITFEKVYWNEETFNERASNSKCSKKEIEDFRNKLNDVKPFDIYIHQEYDADESNLDQVIKDVKTIFDDFFKDYDKECHSDSYVFPYKLKGE